MDNIKFQQTWYHSANPTRRWLHRNRRNWVITTIHRYCRKELSLAIDLGAGIGIYLPHLAGKCRNVISLDINVAFLQTGKQAMNADSVDFINGDLRILPLTDNCADLVICSEVLEHIQENRECLKEIYRILKPEGILLFSTPQPWSLLEITARLALSPFFLPITRLIYQEPVFPTGHINLTSAAKIKKMLREEGFRVTETYRSGLYLPILAELFPKSARNLSVIIEKTIRKNAMAFLLWTQFYVARKREK